MRSLLQRLLPFLFVGLFVWACMQESPRSQSSDPVWSLQMHVHGSFSEGMGSIDSHSYEASELGVDAIWWSDHDFRISSYQHVDHFGFEGPSEAVDAGENWQVKLKRHASDEKTIISASSGSSDGLEFVEQPVRAGERSLLLRIKGRGDEFQTRACILDASRQIQRRPLAGGVSLSLSIMPELVSADARPFVRILLSEHAPREGLELEQYSLRYYLSNEETEPHREGATYHIPLRAEQDRWNDLSLPISRDVARGFPFVPARDNALYRIVVGVEARHGERSQAVFDELNIQHELRGPRMYALQQEVITEVGALYPDLVQHQGVEVSFASRHLNEFSLQAELIDYDELGQDVPVDPETGFFHESSFRRAVTRKAVKDAHARGGLISYNHLFGVGLENSPQGRSREEVLDMMLRNRAFGVDILEVGYRDRAGADLADHLWVWDQLALAGWRLVGTGVSDSHGGPAERWSGRPNNFVSWIYAADTSKPELLAALGRGRLFFGDIERFDGRLDLNASNGWSMGQEVLSLAEEVELELSVSGAQAGDLLLVVAGGEELQRMNLKAEDQRFDLQHTLDPSVSSFVRLELRSQDGRVKALSNPIHWVRPSSLSGGPGIRAARLGIELLGLRSTLAKGFELRSIELLAHGGLVLDLRLLPGAPEALLNFELGSFGVPHEVHFGAGLSGSWELSAGQLALRASGKAGSLTILPAQGE